MRQSQSEHFSFVKSRKSSLKNLHRKRRLERLTLQHESGQALVGLKKREESKIDHMILLEKKALLACRTPRNVVSPKQNSWDNLFQLSSKTIRHLLKPKIIESQDKEVRRLLKLLKEEKIVEKKILEDKINKLRLKGRKEASGLQNSMRLNLSKNQSKFKKRKPRKNNVKVLFITIVWRFNFEKIHVLHFNAPKVKFREDPSDEKQPIHRHGQETFSLDDVKVENQRK